MRKVDLADAYMCIWVRLADIPVVGFLIPRGKDSDPLLVGFHLSIPMGYVYSYSLFFAATKMVKYRALDTLHARGAVPEHPLETLTGAFPPDRDTHQELQEAKADDTWSKLPPQ